MLQPVAVGHKSLADYTHLVGRPLVEEIRELAEALQGLKVLHLSATAFGGGVSEILYTLVPLMRDVGLEADWQIMIGREEFYNVTKLMHNSLQGSEQIISPEEWITYERYNRINVFDPKRDAPEQSQTSPEGVVNREERQTDILRQMEELQLFREGG